MWSENYVRRGVFLFWTCCINQRYPQSPRCEVPGVQTLSLQLNIDGIPLFKSTRTALWPNLCRIKNVSSMAFTVAVFAGDAKPTLKPYLADFLVEFKELMQGGLTFQQRVFKVELNFFLCYAPARAFLKSVKGHSWYHRCERCHQKRCRCLLLHSTVSTSVPLCPKTPINSTSVLSFSLLRMVIIVFCWMVRKWPWYEIVGSIHW